MSWIFQHTLILFPDFIQTWQKDLVLWVRKSSFLCSILLSCQRTPCHQGKCKPVQTQTNSKTYQTVHNLCLESIAKMLSAFWVLIYFFLFFITVCRSSWGVCILDWRSSHLVPSQRTRCTRTCRHFCPEPRHTVLTTWRGRWDPQFCIHYCCYCTVTAAITTRSLTKVIK